MWNPYEKLSSQTKLWLKVSGVATVLLLWLALSGLGIVGPARLPSPMAVAAAFGRLAWNPDGHSPLLEATLYSCMRVCVAGLLIFLVGIPIGILMGSSPRVNTVLSPLVDPFRSAPIVAISPILVMWLGIDEAMKITFLFLGAVVYLIPMVRDAMLAVPTQHYISARDLGASPWEAVMKAVLPMAKPRIADALTVSVSVMWTYITVAEWVNAERGLGKLIQQAGRMSAMDQVFVGIITIIALALLTYALMVWVKRKLYPWETEV